MCIYAHTHVLLKLKKLIWTLIISVSPSAFWQLEARIHFQGCFLYPKPPSICLFTSSYIFCLGGKVTFIRTDLTTHTRMLVLTAQISPCHLGLACYLAMVKPWQHALPRSAGFPQACHLFLNSLHTLLRGKMEKASWHPTHESRSQVQKRSDPF